MKILIEIVGIALVFVGLIFTAQSKDTLGPSKLIYV